LKLVRHFAKTIFTERYPQLKDLAVDHLYRKLYDDFIEPFDAHDNGISAYPSDVKPAFRRPWDIFAQVSVLNPAWNEPEASADVTS